MTEPVPVPAQKLSDVMRELKVSFLGVEAEPGGTRRSVARVNGKIVVSYRHCHAPRTKADAFRYSFLADVCASGVLRQILGEESVIRMGNSPL